MALKVGELFASLSLNSSAYKAGLTEAEASTSSSALKMGAVMGAAMMAVQMVNSLVGLMLKSKKVNLPHGPACLASQAVRQT